MKDIIFQTNKRQWLGLIFAVGLLLPIIGRSEDREPPSDGNLFSFEGTLSLDRIVPDKGVSVSIDRIKRGESGPLAIKVDFVEGTNYSGINFPVPSGGWDLSGYTGVQVEVTNPGTEKISVYLRIDNEGDWKLSPWSVDVLRLSGGETKMLKVPFGNSFGGSGYSLDPSHIIALKFYTDPVKTPFSVLISKLYAYKGGSGSKSSGGVAEGSALPYMTETISPADHKYPYGFKFELVKDWTFGKKRSDATIRNRAELDGEFYYRYIYNTGKLDTLSTYWTVHRDYPENDPKSLHVFGDNTLTLKARIPEGGGLKKGGIESGMLRSKFTVTPGMYIEMRAKLTRGVGAWPAFWLNPGVQNPDGTFSATPWPPELDIFEFFNWQGRTKTKALFTNIQINNQPEKFGNPYTIFTAANKDNEYVPGMDFSEGFHVFALDWHDNRPIWLVDGHPIKQMYYEWNAPPAHILVTNQLGIKFGDMKEMVADESNWEYVIDYIRVWKRQKP